MTVSTCCAGSGVLLCGGGRACGKFVCTRCVFGEDGCGVLDAWVGRAAGIEELWGRVQEDCVVVVWRRYEWVGITKRCGVGNGLVWDDV